VSSLLAKRAFVFSFFLFGFIHCFAQGMIQSFLFNIDAQSSALISGIVHEAQVPVDREFAYLTSHHGTLNLQLCTDIPHGQSPYPCETVFETGPDTISRSQKDSETSRRSLARRAAHTNDFFITPYRNSSGVVDGVTVTQEGQDAIFLSNQCARVLVYPDQELKNMKRESIALIAVQFWLFSISFIAIVYGSIPHTLAVLCARVLATSWSAYAIWRTTNNHVLFFSLITQPDSPCHVELFPSYFKSRMGLEIADLVLNSTALFISAGLSVNMLRMYSAQVFKRVGPPDGVVRIYRVFLAVHVCLLLSVFFLVTAMGLWVDQLMNSAIALISEHTPVYQALFIATTCLLIPWISLGWFGIRREMKLLMTGFLVLAFIFISGWSIMFYSLVYRWTFVQWPFLACITAESYIVMIASMILGVMSWLNFGKGLALYLNAEDALEEADFEHEIFQNKGYDAEKGEKGEWSELDFHKGQQPTLVTLQPKKTTDHQIAKAGAPLPF